MNTPIFTFKYEFESGTGLTEELRYVRNHDINILVKEDGQSNKKLVGKVNFKIVYVNEAINDGYDLYQIFDTYECLFKHSQDFFDFDKRELKSDIQNYYKDEFLNDNICFLERIEVIPEYRGFGLGAKATKDIIFHFGSSCGLFIMQPYPLQLENKPIVINHWREQLKLDKFPSNKIKAFKQLKNYYINMGFETIPGYTDLLFINPAIRNAKMEAINLEE